MTLSHDHVLKVCILGMLLEWEVPSESCVHMSVLVAEPHTRKHIDSFSTQLCRLKGEWESFVAMNPLRNCIQQSQLACGFMVCALHARCNDQKRNTGLTRPVATGMASMASTAMAVPPDTVYACAHLTNAHQSRPLAAGSYCWKKRCSLAGGGLRDWLMTRLWLVKELATISNHSTYQLYIYIYMLLIMLNV